MSEETKDAELAAVDANEPLFFNVPDNAAVLVDVLLNAPVTVPPPPPSKNTMPVLNVLSLGGVPAYAVFTLPDSVSSAVSMR
jgi:hypothetical protein